MASSATANTSITASARVREFASANFHTSDGLLFCTPCNKSISHVRRSTITDHLKSSKHQQLSKLRDRDSSPAKRQRTIITSSYEKELTAKKQRENICQDIVKALVASNIPIEKADDPAFRNFLTKHVNGGGAIPEADQLRTKYLPTIFEEHNSKLHAMFSKESFIAIIVDETCDFENRPLLNILFQRLQSIDDVCDTLLDLPSPAIVNSVYLKKQTMLPSLKLSFNVVRIIKLTFRKFYSSYPTVHLTW